MEKDTILLKTLFLKAYNLFLDKHYPDSLNLISHTAEMWIDYEQKYKFLFLMGADCFKMGQYDKAERALLESLAIYPENPRALDILGQLYFVQKKYVDSEKAFLSAKRNDAFNFTFSLKTAKSAWKSGNYLRMFKRLREGYIPNLIGTREETKLKVFLLDFLRNSNVPEAYSLIKDFRRWCFDRNRKLRKKNKKKH